MPKQLVQFRDEPLVCRAARLLLDLGANPVIVVCGHAGEEVSNALHQALADRSDWLAVTHAEWALGLGSSIARGCRELPPDVAGMLLMLCDQWRIEAPDLERLKMAWLNDISGIYCAEWKLENRLIKGPPAIFPRSKIRELISNKNGMGARPVMAANRSILSTVCVPGAASDLDTPEDLQALRLAQRM
jgi:molybdenum cofactor cytidylyltransferase